MRAFETYVRVFCQSPGQGLGDAGVGQDVALVKCRLFVQK